MNLRTLVPLALLVVAVPALATTVDLDTSGSTVTAEPGVPVAFEMATGSIYDVQFDAQVTLNVGGTPQTQTRTCGVTSGLQLACSGVGSVDLHPVDGLPGAYAFNVGGMHVNMVRVVFPTFMTREEVASWWGGYLFCDATEEEIADCQTHCAPQVGLASAVWTEATNGDWFCRPVCDCPPQFP
jgi:hypothetical protein